MEIYDKNGYLLDILVPEQAVSTWVESNRILVWIHVAKEDIDRVMNALGVSVIFVVYPQTRGGSVKIIADRQLVPISGDVIHLN